MPRINNQMRYLLSQKENDLEGIKPYIQDVHDMVRELCKELGTAPIEDIVAWHQDTTPYRSLIKLFINYIKHCRIKFHKGEYLIGRQYWRVCGKDLTRYGFLALHFVKIVVNGQLLRMSTPQYVLG